MNNIRKYLTLGGCALLGGVAGALGARFGPSFSHSAPWSRGQVASLLLLLPVAWLLAVLLHELGHVLAGRTKGFRFYWLAVGPFMWKKEAGQLRFSWNTDLNTAGGMALCVPPDDQDLRRRFLAFALGGPLGSLAWAAVALGAYALLPPAISAVGQVLAGALAVSGGISALLVVVTLIPMHVGGFNSDGARALTMWRGGPGSQLEIAVLSALVRSVVGVRPRELPRPGLEAAAALPQETPFKLYVFYYLYLIALDAGHIAQAAHYLREHRARLTGVPDALQAAAWLESAFFAAAYEHDLPAARAFQGQAKPTAHTPTDVPARVEAALARLAGDTDRARAQAQTSLQALPKNLDQGSALFYAEWLADTLRWANEPLPLPR